MNKRFFDYKFQCISHGEGAFDWTIQAATINAALRRLAVLDPRAQVVSVTRHRVTRINAGPIGA